MSGRGAAPRNGRGAGLYLWPWQGLLVVGVSPCCGSVCLVWESEAFGVGVRDVRVRSGARFPGAACPGPGLIVAPVLALRMPGPCHRAKPPGAALAWKVIRALPIDWSKRWLISR